MTMTREVGRCWRRIEARAWARAGEGRGRKRRSGASGGEGTSSGRHRQEVNSGGRQKGGYVSEEREERVKYWNGLGVHEGGSKREGRSRKGGEVLGCEGRNLGCRLRGRFGTASVGGLGGRECLVDVKGRLWLRGTAAQAGVRRHEEGRERMGEDNGRLGRARLWEQERDGAERSGAVLGGGGAAVVVTALAGGGSGGRRGEAVVARAGGTKI